MTKARLKKVRKWKLTRMMECLKAQIFYNSIHDKSGSPPFYDIKDTQMRISKFKNNTKEMLA